MLPKESLKDLLSQKSLSNSEKLLICLAVDTGGPKAVKEIREMAVASGLRAAKKWNVSAQLGRETELAVRAVGGWELTAKGSHFVAKVAGPLMNSPILKVASSLRVHLVKITSADSQSFIEEAIGCFESRQYRAAVVLSWVGAVSVLQSHVVNHCLASFNAEAQKRYPKWKTARTTDDLGLIKEDTFLDILQAISVIGKNVKQELKKGLTLRNGCGHPNSLKIAEHKASSHIEDLMLNVFAVF